MSKFRIVFILLLFIISLPVLQNSRAELLEEELAEEDEEGSVGIIPTDREELYDYLLHPIDLNLCSEGDLLVIPWLSPKTARNIILYREKIKGFWRKDELLKVPGVNKELYEKMAPYVAVTPEEKIKASPFHGDTRIRLKIDEPRDRQYMEAEDKWKHPLYLYNRTRIQYGEKYEAGWVMIRDDEGLRLTAKNIQNYFLIKNYLLMRNVFFFDKIVAGNYYLHFNQGLIFYYPFNELVRPVKGKPRGVREDKSTGRNAYLKGLAVEKRNGPFHYTFFLSDKPLMAKVEEDGTVAKSIYSLRDEIGYID